MSHDIPYTLAMMVKRLAMNAPLCLLFVAGGIGHFVSTPKFLGLMEGLPFPSLHTLAVHVTGVMEIILGFAILVHPSPNVCYALMALVTAMTPANINMCV